MGFCRKGQHRGHVACSRQPGLLPASDSAPYQWEKLWQWLGPCLLRKIERKCLCVLLQIMCFLWSTLVIPEFVHPWPPSVHISQAFVERSTGSHSVCPGGGVRSWGLNKNINLQDCIMTDTDWLISTFIVTWLIWGHLEFVNRVANKIFFFHVHNNFFKCNLRCSNQC